MRENKSIFDCEETYYYLGTASTQILSSLCGITFPSPDYKMLRENTNVYSIEYVYSGEGIIYEDSHFYQVHAGDFFILHPHKYHHYYSVPENPWKKIFLTTDGNTEFMTNLLKIYHIEDKTIFKGVNSPLQLEEIFELFKSPKVDISRDLEILIFSMIADLSRKKNEAVQQNNFIDTAKNFINKRINTKLMVSEVSEHVGMNYSYFSRAFKKHEGISPNQYIKQQKMLFAQKMLNETKMTIPKIAELLSFPDTAYFSNEFKSFFGITASAYRAKVQSKNK